MASFKLSDMLQGLAAATIGEIQGKQLAQQELLRRAQIEQQQKARQAQLDLQRQQQQELARYHAQTLAGQEAERKRRAEAEQQRGADKEAEAARTRAFAYAGHLRSLLTPSSVSYWQKAGVLPAITGEIDAALAIASGKVPHSQWAPRFPIDESGTPDTSSLSTSSSAPGAAAGAPAPGGLSLHLPAVLGHPAAPAAGPDATSPTAALTTAPGAAPAPRRVFPPSPQEEAAQRRLQAAAEAQRRREEAQAKREKARQEEAARRSHQAALTRYQSLLHALPSWGRLDAATQRPLFRSLKEAGAAAGVDPASIPTGVTLNPPTPRPTNPAQQQEQALREYQSMLRHSTTPGFLKLPAATRVGFLTELSAAAKRAGKQVPAGTIDALRGAVISDTRKQTAGKLSPVNQKLFNAALKTLTATKKVAGIDTGEFERSPQERQQAADLLRGILRDSGSDPAAVNALAPSVPPPAVRPKAAPSAPGAAPAPRAITPARPSRAAAPAAAPRVKVSPQVLNMARDLIFSHQFDAAMQSPLFADPGRRIHLKRAYRQITGREWAGEH